MDKRIEKKGKEALFGLAVEVETTESKRILVDAGDLEALIRYALALQELPAKTTYDVYLQGEWWNTILKVDLTESEVALLRRLEERSRDTEATVLVERHEPSYPLPNWKGYTRK